MHKLMVMAAFVPFIQACATHYDSACHELASTQRSELNSMIRKASRSSFERHVVVLETGTEINSSCRTHYIDKGTFVGIPGSLREKCQLQAKVSDKYCILYQVDKEVVKERIY